MLRFTLPLALLAPILAGPAAAFDACDDLWFSRNLAFDQAGYCFGSALGQAVFDNADCTSTDARPDAEGQAVVEWVQRREAEEGCAVDTSRTTLDIDNLALRRALEPPIVMLAPSASGCLGWTGAPIPLFAGPRAGAAQIGTAHPGDDIDWEYDWLPPTHDWGFVTLYRDGVQVGLGWMQGNLDPALCTGNAG